MNRRLKIFIAPLDWGLGHATRCIPLIRAFLAEGADVVLGVSGAAGSLLRQEFPQLEHEPLPPYAPVYPAGANMVTAMAGQFGRLIHVIRQEGRVLRQLQQKHQFDLVISDNRYGLHLDDVPCIMLNHQLFLKMPGWFKLAQGPVNQLNHHYLKQFTEVWVPDWADSPSLSGALSHPPGKLPHIHYIGPLSRFIYKAGPVEPGKILVLISGPEPQRSIFQELLARQAKGLPYRFMFVLGKPETTEKHHEGNIMFTDHLDAAALQHEISSAEAVICRSGYSGIMDLVTMRKKALLIPTPGQTEQEYLARHLQFTGLFVSQRQQELDMGSGLEALLNKQPPDSVLTGDFNLYQQRIRHWVQRLG